MTQQEKLDLLSRIVNDSYCMYYTFLENVGRAELPKLISECQTEKDIQELANKYI